MPKHLTSRFYRVALSGKTADGRNINSQDLLDMAENYDMAKYPAVIWIDHDRWWDTCGVVSAVEAREESDGKIGLYAQLRPNQLLLSLNEQGQKQFTSIEITPDFADTGKAYLTGLAVTDQPASLGTEQLYFTKTKQQAPFIKPESQYFTNNFQLNFSEPEQATLPDKESFFRSFLSWLTPTPDQQPTETNTMALQPKSNAKKRNKFTFDPDSLAAYIAARDQLQAVLDGMNTVIDGVEADPTPPSQEVSDAIDTAEAAAEIVAADVVETDEMSAKKIADAIYSQVMAKLTATPANGRKFTQTTGAAKEQPRKRVL